ncbi:hypothetical protein [Actinomadura harenae]|uniref:Uncharacterized protein n=1 Tax=Actinomadura harenae TaxID=2483351 RepID=A0A3M2M4F0_9ACTN|nr:hypothetical protein [Actinomadura harenae]RMI44332.1 hypothetical protein EBO15_13115 [Actinomadura harenae]
MTRRRTPNRNPGRCPTGKVRFRDRIAATLALATIQRQGRQDRDKAEARAYRCPACSGWHLTSQHPRVNG